jgi:hypothetical protein
VSDPPGRAGERRGYEAAAADAPGPFAHEQARFLEHPEVLRDRRQREVERLGQLAHVGGANGKASQHSPARGIGKGPEGHVESAFRTDRHPTWVLLPAV